MESLKNKEFTIFGLILGLSFFLSAVIISSTFLSVKKLDNNISVSGSAKIAVVSDSARWNGSFSRTVRFDQLKEGYSLMKQDEKKVRDFLTDNGFGDKFEIAPVFMYEVYSNDQYAPKEYSLSQSVEVKGNDVEAMKSLAKNVEELIKKDVFFSPAAVEYYYSQLPAVRVSLLPDAIKDAKERAKSIAESSGKKVDSVKSVNMGVVQVMSAGAIDISDYGSYDTSTINKEVMITVKATFGLK